MALTDSLVSYWKLDEESGQRADSHGSNHLTDVNTVGFAAGKIGNAANFIWANNEALSISHNATLALEQTSCTFAVWVKATTVGNYFSVFGKASAASKGYYLTYTTSGGMQFGMGSNVNCAASKPLSAGTWYFFVCGYSAADDQVYIQMNNGTRYVTNQTTNSTAETVALTIGDWPLVYPWDGLIDSVGIWSRVLTAPETTALYGAGTPPEYPWAPPGRGGIFGSSIFNSAIHGRALVR